MAVIRYPQFPRIPGVQPEVQRAFEEWGSALISELEARDNVTLFGAANATPYILVSVSVQRTLNVQTANVSTVAAVLGTLINDFISHGDLT